MTLLITLAGLLALLSLVISMYRKCRLLIFIHLMLVVHLGGTLAVVSKRDVGEIVDCGDYSYRTRSGLVVYENAVDYYVISGTQSIFTSSIGGDEIETYYGEYAVRKDHCVLKTGLNRFDSMIQSAKAIDGDLIDGGDTYGE